MAIPEKCMFVPHALDLEKLKELSYQENYKKERFFERSFLLQILEHENPTASYLILERKNRAAYPHAISQHHPSTFFAMSALSFASFA